MPSKFGGIPVEDEQPRRSRFGGIPVDDNAAPSAAPAPPPAARPGFMGRLTESLNPLPALAHPLETAKAIWMQPGIRANQAFDAFKRGNISEGLGRTLQAIPIIGGAAEVGERMAEDLKAGNYGGAAGSFTGLLAPSAAGPAIARGAGGILKRAAAPLAENALGIRGQARAYGATPGKAILEETRGVRPSTIAESAQTRIGELTDELNAAADRSNKVGSLAPARDVIEGDIATHESQNAVRSAHELVPMRKFFTEPNPRFVGAVKSPPPPPEPPPGVGLYDAGGNMITAPPAPSPLPPRISPRQSARMILGMKRGFSNDFIDSWSPNVSSQGALGTARKAYHALDQELDRIVPGAPALDQRIQSLIPVVKRAELTGLNAGIGERMLGRIARPTGALTGAVFGLHKAGLPGLATGLGLPEVISAPGVQMIGARTLYGIGSGLRHPVLQRAAQFAPLVRAQAVQ